MPRLATYAEDLLEQSEALKLSGLEFMQKILDGTNPGPPIGGTMGYSLHSVEEGRCVFRGAPEFNVTNPMGTVHGGWYGLCSLWRADHSFLCFLFNVRLSTCR